MDLISRLIGVHQVCCVYLVCLNMCGWSTGVCIRIVVFVWSVCLNVCGWCAGVCIRIVVFIWCVWMCVWVIYRSLHQDCCVCLVCLNVCVGDVQEFASGLLCLYGVSECVWGWSAGVCIKIVVFIWSVWMCVGVICRSLHQDCCVYLVCLNVCGGDVQEFASGLLCLFGLSECVCGWCAGVCIRIVVFIWSVWMCVLVMCGSLHQDCCVYLVCLNVCVCIVRLICRSLHLCLMSVCVCKREEWFSFFYVYWGVVYALVYLKMLVPSKNNTCRKMHFILILILVARLFSPAVCIHNKLCTQNMYAW